MSAATIFSFPAHVNEKAARSVAGLVVVTSAAAVVLSLTASSAWLWLSAPLALGFLLRVVSGPSLSPFALLATRVIAPRLGVAKPVPGAPKRFAQALGFGMTAAATVLTALSLVGAAQIVLAGLIVAAGLESVFALCLGCKMFALGMRLGVVPESACPECADISLHFAAGAATSVPEAAHATVSA